MNANKQDVGGLPELPEPCAEALVWHGPLHGSQYMRLSRGADYTGTAEYSADQMRAYGELCRAAPAGGDALPWRCFHCDEVFTTGEAAALHFGTREYQSPACQIDVAAYREMEALQLRYLDEDADVHRAMYRMQSEHQQALRRAEEDGYAKGVRAAEKDSAPAVSATREGDGEEDAYVIEQMGRLLAEIAIIVNGPEPTGTRWSYHDLPEKVRTLSRVAVQEGMVLVPKVPTQEMLAVIRDEQFPEDWNAGKQLQAAAGFDVVPPECGIEIAAGQYLRLLAIAASQRQEGE